MRAENTTDTRTRAVRRAATHHPVIVIVAALIGFVLGAGYVQYGPSNFTATSSLLVTPLIGNPYTTSDRGATLDSLQTEAQVVTTDTVAAKAATTLKATQTPAQLRSHVTATVPVNTQVIDIAFKGSSPDAARNGAEAFASAYLAYRIDRSKQTVNSSLASINTQIASTTAALRDIADKQAGQQRSSYLDGRSSALSKQLATLETSRSTLSTQVLDPGTVISPANTPASSNKSLLVILALVGLILGAILGWTIALLRELTTAKIRSAGDIEVLGIPVLAEICIPGPGRKSAKRSGAVEAGYRELRTALVASLGEAGDTGPIVSVIDASEAGAAAVVSASLSSVFARSGIEVTLLDAGGSTRASASAIYYLAQQPGLSEVLLDGRRLSDVSVDQFAGLRIVPAGTTPGGSVDHFLSPQMRRTFDALRADGRYVVVAAGSATDATGQSVAILSDAVVLAVPTGSATSRSVQTAYHELERTGATILGVVLIGRAAMGVNTAVTESAPEQGKVSLRNKLVPSGAGSADGKQSRGGVKQK